VCHKHGQVGKHVYHIIMQLAETHANVQLLSLCFECADSCLQAGATLIQLLQAHLEGSNPAQKPLKLLLLLLLALRLAS
jgi:hypothetical protein